MLAAALALGATGAQSQERGDTPASDTPASATPDAREVTLQASRDYLVGATLTVADLPIACEMHRWRGLPLAWRARPRLDAWYDRLRSLPAARGVLDLPLS